MATLLSPECSGSTSKSSGVPLLLFLLLPGTILFLVVLTHALWACSEDDSLL
jgi:hypothetical protein